MLHLRMRTVYPLAAAGACAALGAGLAQAPAAGARSRAYDFIFEPS